jgi:ABC-type uncharacterized transport system involved in gliding motility auxiliary subunit
MNKLLRNLNYIALVLIVVGFALVQSYGWSNLYGTGALLAGVAGLIAYLYLHREQLKSKNSRFNFVFASNLLLIVLLVLAIVAAVNYLGTKVHKRFDYTVGRVHSLADQSIQVVKRLDRPLLVTVFAAEGSAPAAQFRELTDLYRYYSDKVRAEIVDPYKNPALVQKYDVKYVNTVVFEYGKKNTRVEQVSEESFTNAIIKLTRDSEKTVYFTQGHGEADVEKSDEFGLSELKKNLEKLSFKVKPLLLAQEKTLPADVSLLVVAGPQQPFFANEIKMIDDYLSQKGGRAFFLLGPDQGGELNPLLNRAGLKLDATVVVQPKDELTMALTGADHFTVYANKGAAHDITKNFTYTAIFPFSRGLSRVAPPPKEAAIDTILNSGTNSWAATNYDEMMTTRSLVQKPDDRIGPIDLMTAVRSGNGARLVVAGNSRFPLNAYIAAQGGVNGMLFSNTVSWLTEEGDLIAIPPRAPDSQQLVLTPSGTKLAFFGCLIILPLLTLLAGIAVWLYRRKL